MKRLKFPILAAILTMTAMLAGCGKTEHWAYNHEPDKDALVLYDNGKAELDGESFTYTKNETVISLKDASGNTVDHRYITDDAHDQIYFYKSAVYTQYQGERLGIFCYRLCVFVLYSPTLW